MDLDTLAKRNTVAQSKIKEFQASLSPDDIPFNNDRFHQFKNDYPYYGIIGISLEGCKPFLMFSGNDDIVAMTYFWYGDNSYEPTSMVEWIKRCKNAKTVIDVGAFSGLYTLATLSASDARLIAFEPTRRVYSRLLVNVGLNNFFERVSLVNLGLSDTSREQRFYQFRGEKVLGAGASYVKKEIPHTSDDELVKLVTLDSYVKAHKLAPDMVKIDVEVAELDVLNGFKDSLHTFHPILLVEISPKTVHGVFNLLKTFGYKMYLVDEIQKKLRRLNSELVEQLVIDLKDPDKYGLQLANILAE